MIDYQIIFNSIYLIALLYVFFIQKKKLEKIEGVTSSIESFFKIFDVDEVEKFVKLKEESARLKYSNLLADNEKHKKLIKDISDESIKHFEAKYAARLENQMYELAYFTEMILVQMPKEKRDKAMTELLPNTSYFFEDVNQDPVK